MLLHNHTLALYMSQKNEEKRKEREYFHVKKEVENNCQEFFKSAFNDYIQLYV